MFTVSSFMRYFAYPRCVKSLTLLKKQFAEVHKLERPFRYIHHCTHLCAKMFTEYENIYAYNLMENKGYAVKLDLTKVKNIETHNSLTEEQFNKMLVEDWSSKTPADLLEAFALFAAYCSEHKQCISNKMFDNFIDCLTDSLRVATEKELEMVFYTLEKWPQTQSVRTRNFIEVWAALDDECYKRMKEWSYDKLLHFVSLFYLINVSKLSDFSVKAVNKMASKAKNLTSAQLVQTLFFIGLQRRPPFDMHNTEVQLDNLFPEFNVDELAIMSMGFFKSKTPIRSMDLVLKIVDKVIENSQTIHEMSLTSILKVIRYSMKFCLDDRIERLLDSLQHEVPRLSLMCNVHIALLGTATLTLDKECLTKIADKLHTCFAEARLKDLERLMLTYATFNFVPESGDNFLQSMVDEFKRPEREDEIKRYGRSFALCISYAGLLGLYPVDLINKVLSPEFLQLTYGTSYNYGREVLMLYNSTQIFCPDAKVNSTLSDKTVIMLAKKYTDYIPSEEYTKNYNVTEKMFLDVFRIMQEDRGNDYITADHILPHHQRGDIIACNSNNGTHLPVQAFDTSNFGLMKKPPDSNKWIVMIIAGRNCIIRNSDTPTGLYQSKARELAALGYYPVLVSYSIYSGLPTTAKKIEYLNNLIKEAFKKEL